jgi:ribosomal protein S18 acetylase RimI-like enzyme
MNTIVITKPTLDDIETMFQWGENNWELWGNVESKWYSKSGLIQCIEQPRDDVQLIARVDSQLAGMCMTHVLQGWALCDGLYVAPEFRKLGIGKMLLAKTVEQLKKKNIEEFSLLCDVENNEGLAFYKKVGFREGMKFIWMYKTLTEEHV